MRRFLLLGLLFSTRVAGLNAQTPGTSPTPAAGTGVVEGTVSLAADGGAAGKMAGLRVHLVSLEAARPLAPVCEMRDSVRKRYVRARRPVRVAFDSARVAPIRARDEWLARAATARATAMAILDTAARADVTVYTVLANQPSMQTGEDGRFEFTNVPEGEYALFGMPEVPFIWFDTVRVAPGRQTRDLDIRNATPVTSTRGEAIGREVCWAIRPAPPAADSTPRKPAVGEEQPVMTNRAEAQAALTRYFPRGLNGGSGSVSIRMRILEDGSVDPLTVEAINSNVPEESAVAETEAAAESVAERMRFRPARVGGHAVPVWVTLPVVFAAQR